MDLNDLMNSAPLPALPNSALLILQLSKDPANGPAEYAAAIETDAALASQVLHFINSSYFGFCQRVASVRHGISLVGVKIVKNFVLWTAVFSTTFDPRCEAFQVDVFRRDSLRRGIGARLLGKCFHVDAPDELFTAGLLQDLAVPLLVKHCPAVYERLLSERHHAERLSALEQRKWGWSHADAAALLLEHWNLPAHTVELVRTHTQIASLVQQPHPRLDACAVALSALLPSVYDEAWRDAQAMEDYYNQLRDSRAPSFAEFTSDLDAEFSEVTAMLLAECVPTSLTAMYEHAAESLPQ